MAITPSIRHCSNKYKLAREGEKDKEEDKDFEKVNNHQKFHLKKKKIMQSSRVERDEFSVVA